jgi:hypothetical protein
VADTNPHGLHRMRHDCAALFAKVLLPELGTPADAISWDMTPCAVRLYADLRPAVDHGDGTITPPTAVPEWYVARHPYQLLALPDETEVLCAWPGARKQDFFRFTVGEFREAWEARAAEQEGGAQ